MAKDKKQKPPKELRDLVAAYSAWDADRVIEINNDLRGKLSDTEIRDRNIRAYNWALPTLVDSSIRATDEQSDAIVEIMKDVLGVKTVVPTQVVVK